MSLTIIRRLPMAAITELASGDGRPGVAGNLHGAPRCRQIVTNCSRSASLLVDWGGSRYAAPVAAAVVVGEKGPANGLMKRAVSLTWH